MRAQPVVQRGRIEKRLRQQVGAEMRRVGIDPAVGAERVFGIVAQPFEAVGLRPVVERVHVVGEGSAAADGRIGIAGIVGAQHVADQVVLVEVDRIGGVARAVRVQALDTRVVVGVRAGEPLVDSDVVQGVEGLKGAVRSGCRIPGARRLDAIPVIAVAAQIGRREIGIAAFLGLVEAPVLAVDVEMVVAAARVGHAHLALGVAREGLAHEGVEIAVLKCPRVILRGAQVDLVELGGAFAVEERETQLARAVVRAEKKAQRVLGIVDAAAERAADANSRVDVELGGRAARRIDQFDRDRPLPADAVVAGIGVDAGLRPEQVREVGDQGERRDCVGHAGAQPRRVAVDDRLAHAVFHDVVVHRAVRGPTRRGRRSLPQHVLQEKPSDGGDALLHALRIDDCGAQRGCGGHGQRRGVERAAIRGRAAVERVADFGIRPFGAGERGGEGRRLVAARLADRDRGRRGRVGAAVRGAGGRRLEVERMLGGGAPGQRGLDKEVPVCGGLVERGDGQHVGACGEEGCGQGNGQRFDGR
ncbi:MAG: hypothetical protein BWX70_01510 [Verrucomicrobia bacterium ADurb.Bin070]|nr:MAG: hypothetical protein BWX70_01510 [Verrucomicrobia bacterium ADurb.Bin070]